MYPSTLHCIEKSPELALSLKEVKEYLKITHDDEDGLITHLIQAVIAICESHTSRALLYQTWQASYRQFARSSLTLPIKPVQKINHIYLIDRNGKEHRFEEIHYKLWPLENEIYFSSFPLSYLLRIEFVAGFGATSDHIPKNLKAIMFAHVAHLYCYRAMESEFPISRYDEFFFKRM